MKLYKISLLALALTAGAFTSCSDDDEYVVGAQSAGAYFSNELGKNVMISSEATTADIPVMRTSTDGAETVNITVTDESGLFTIPASVSFAAGSNTANLTISYDPSKLESDHPYPVTLAIPEGSQTMYGASSVTLQLVMKSPMIEVKGPLGTYTYTSFFSGTDPDLTTTISYSDKDPKRKTYTLHHWGYDVDLNIILDENIVYTDGTMACYVPNQYVGYDDPEGPIYICDIYTYTGREDYDGYSYYDPETGLFSMYVYYHLEDGRGVSPGYEYFQLDGFPDYSVSVTYDGVFINASGKHTYAIATANVGPDVEQALVANLVGGPTETTIDDMINGNIPTEVLGPGLGQELRFEIEGSGSYTLVAIAISKDTPVNASSTSYKVELGTSGGGDDQDGWETIGYAPYVDGWVNAAFRDPFENAFWVEIQANTQYDNVICLHNPYVDFPGNEGNGKANIVFDLYDPELVAVYPQYTGFDLSGSGLPWGDEWYAGNYEGLLLAFGAEDLRTELWNDYMNAPEYPGLTIAQVMIDEEELNSYIDEDGIIVPVPLIGGPEEFGYTWNAGYPTVIFLSEMIESLDDLKAPARKTVSQIKYTSKLISGYSKVKMVDKQARKAAKKVRRNKTLAPLSMAQKTLSKRDIK